MTHKPKFYTARFEAFKFTRDANYNRDACPAWVLAERWRWLDLIKFDMDDGNGGREWLMRWPDGRVGSMPNDVFESLFTAEGGAS